MSKLKWIFFDVGSTLVDEVECYKQRLIKIANAGGVEMAAIHHPDLDLNIILPRESYIKDFMDLFMKEYGTVEGYFERIGVSEETREKLRNKLLD